MRWFVQQSIKGGRVSAFKQHYESEKKCNDILEIIPEEIIVKKIF